MGRIINPKSPKSPFSPTQELDTSSTNPTTTHPTYYQEWFMLDKRRRELLYYISQAIQQLKGTFSYQRQKGLDQLIDLLSNQLISHSDHETFNLIHKNINEDTNVVLSITKYMLKRQMDDNMDMKNDDEENVSSAVLNNLNTRETRLQEIKKSLTVLEGCFLLYPACSATFAAINGFKIILTIITDGAMYVNSAKYMNLKHSTKSASSIAEQQQIEELAFHAFDTLESSLHNSAANTIIFCKDSGPDLIIAMLRNQVYSVAIRTKCVEFIGMLFKWAKNADMELKESDTDDSNEQDTYQTLLSRLRVYLGAKLTDDLVELINKVTPANSEELADRSVFIPFVQQVAQR
jgi:hypothetical protein